LIFCSNFGILYAASFWREINPRPTGPIHTVTFCQGLRKPWHRDLIIHWTLVGTLKLKKLMLANSDDLASEPWETRTPDTLIKSQVLYQLS
jgi:hypothetical protein